MEPHFCALAHSQDGTFSHVAEVINECENDLLGAPEAESAMVDAVVLSSFEHDQTH